MASDCLTCREIELFDRTGTSEIFYMKSLRGLWYVGLNPKYSPYLGRSFATTKRHLGNEAVKFGFGALREYELGEQRFIEGMVRAAIMLAFDRYGLERIDNYTKMDAAHAKHPDRDFVPHYMKPFRFEGLEFGREPGVDRKILLKSYADASDMPLPIRRIIIQRIRNQLEKAIKMVD